MAGPYLNTGPFKTRITDTTPTPDEELGVWRFEAGKILRFVKAATAVIPAREAVRYDHTVTTAALIGCQVIQTSGPTNILAGIAEVTIAGLNFGWITIYGPATARVADATVAGGALGPTTNTGVLALRATVSPAYAMEHAIALAAGLSSGSAIFVRL